MKTGLICAVVALVSVASVYASPSYTSYAPFPPGVTVPFDYPLYKQCNGTWANDLMVTDTICQVGCLMSSISMAIGGHGITIDGQVSDPGTLNAWLVQNGGYNSANSLYESVIPNVDPSAIAYKGALYNNTALSGSQIKAYLNDESSIVIANVRDGTHFVLVVGYDSGDTNWYVNDPGFDDLVYTYDTIVGWRLFTITGNSLGDINAETVKN